MSRTNRAVVLCLVVILIRPSAGVTTVTAQAPTTKAAPAIAAPEARDVHTFLASVLKFDDDLAASKRGAKSQGDSARFRQRASDLKQGVPAARRSLTTLIARLKDTGNWTPEFDKQVEDRMRQQNIDPTVISYYKSHGGARNVFADGDRVLAQLSDDVDRDLRELTASNVDWLRPVLPEVVAIAKAVKCGALFLVTGICIGFGIAPCAIGTGASALVCAAS